MVVGLLLLVLLVGNRSQLEEVQVSKAAPKCENDTNIFLQEIIQKNPKDHAVVMCNASGEMGSNVKRGNGSRHGMMEDRQVVQCPMTSEQYRQGTLEYFEGVCVPDSCSEEDLQILLQNGKLCPEHLFLYPTTSSSNASSQEITTTRCLFNVNAPDAFDVTCLFVCSVMVAIPLAATLFTALIHWQRNKDVAPSPESSQIYTDYSLYGTLRTNGSCSSETNQRISEGKNTSNHTRLCFSRHLLERLLLMFSLQNTSKGVLSTASSVPGGAYSSLYGIRVLSLLWIMCGHLAEFTLTGNLDKDWEETLKSNPLYVISYSGPVYLAVDTFLLMGGLLSARSLLNSINRAEGKMNTTLVARYLLKRIKRIQPLNIFIMCLTIGLFYLVSMEPFVLPHFEADCKEHWWANVLLINNLIGTPYICIPWSWYLSLDFQFYATTPLLVLLYKLNLRVFTVVVGALLLSSTAVGAIVTALMQMPVFRPLPTESHDYMVYYYGNPFTRYGPFLIGIITGICMTTKTDQLIKQRRQAAVGWFCSLSLMALLVEMAYILKETPSYPSVPHALYQGLHRTLWTCAVSWIIVACEEGYGGFVKSFLCWCIWIPLSNISLACYLLHPLLIALYDGVQETPFNYTDLNFMFFFFALVVTTLVISYLLTVLIERPYLFKFT